MSDSMDTTRRQLRSYLLSGSADPAGQADDDHFPRSKVMRFAFNPRNRKLLMLSGSVLAVVATRFAGTKRMGLVADIARSLARHKA